MTDSKNTFGNAAFQHSISTYIQITSSNLHCNLVDEKFTTTQIYAEYEETIVFEPRHFSYDPDVADRNSPQVGSFVVDETYY